MSLDNTSLDIRAILIVEVLGKPQEHLIEALKDIINKMDSIAGVSVIEKIINSPTPLEKQPGFFTSFAEIEVSCESVNHIVSLMFNFMPSHIEILTPEKITMSNNSWNDILNELGRKLHQYDGLAKIIQMEKKILEDKVRNLSLELEKSTNSNKEENKETRVQEGI